MTKPADDQTAVLRLAVDSAVHAVLHVDPRHGDARRDIDRVLATLAGDVAPVWDRLSALADETPDDPVGTVVGFLRDAREHAAAGDVQAARVALIAARTTLFRLDRPRR
ncbi:hypothetical protein [Saccharothrix hoggarensis]|uniref:Uncharacterized protein n=1 Tax=Saccharothrix hoggarensis TaxID=913853 RepID=A0ABW3QZ04_9PSEU